MVSVNDVIDARVESTHEERARRLSEMGSETYNNDTRTSRHCSVRFASPSYRGALSSCAHNGKITSAGNPFDPHVP